MSHAPQRGRLRRNGSSLLEVLVVLTVIGILLSMSVPTFQRGVEQSRADIAAANLRAIWSAQRLYWLENHQYTTSFSDLAPLLDPTIASATTFYVYNIRSADGSTFTATATRLAGSRWNGQLTMDESGAVAGSIQAAGEAPVVPGFQ